MNIHENHRGRKVRTLASSRHRRYGTDFPGWDAPDAADHLLEAEPGLTGTITSVESHGSNPWTRYSVRFDDGSHTAGLVLGTDIEFIR